MSADSNARSHAEAFRWWAGNPEMSDEEAHLHDLLALHRATTELIREQRVLLRCYDADPEPLDDDPDES